MKLLLLLTIFINSKISVLDIETINHEMPAYTVVYAPEGCIGTSITDNQYVPGRMTMTLHGDTLYDSKEYEKDVSGMRIKVRGNSTGAFMAQHPYKIKLSKKYDLLHRDDKAYRHKEWLLLPMYVWNKKMTNQESNILNIAGLTVSRIIGMPWTPEYDFVNVTINGEYQGMYYLIEPVSRGEKRVNIDDTGFLIEHDTFWWNEETYFKTDRQISTCAYTYKYPDSDDVTEDIQSAMIRDMNEAEKLIYENGDIRLAIDVESFAKWILVHDILGTDDTAGCNRFLCRKSDASPLEMGPTWDYDSSFRSDDWSTQHISSWFYYPQLFQNKDFVNVYISLWNNIRPTLMDQITTAFDEVWQKYGQVFDENMKIHQTVYPDEGHQALKAQIDEVLERFNERITILDNLMTQYDTSNLIKTTSQRPFTTGITDMMGRKCQHKNNVPKGFYLYQYDDGTIKKKIVK